MNLESIVRTAITPLRLSPHGVTLTTIGSLLCYFSSDIPLISVSVGVAGLCTTICGIIDYYTGLSDYRKTVKNIKKYHSLSEESVHNYAKYYCSRQAARTAAINHNLQQEFDSYLATYPGKMEYKFLPLI